MLHQEGLMQLLEQIQHAGIVLGDSYLLTSCPLAVMV